MTQLGDCLDDDRVPLTLAQQEELDRRLATLERNRCEGIAWAALKAELQRRCP